jgi:hypothetical protein
MKRLKVLTGLFLAILVLLLVGSVLDFLAGTDIYHDYVSKTVVAGFWADGHDILPNWTNTKGEWAVMNFSFVMRLICIVAGFVLYFMFRGEIRKFGANTKN